MEAYRELTDEEAVIGGLAHTCLHVVVKPGRGPDFEQHDEFLARLRVVFNDTHEGFKANPEFRSVQDMSFVAPGPCPMSG